MSPPKASDRATIAAREFARQEGVDPKAVRRALETGRLRADSDGKPYADQVGSGWYNPRKAGGDKVGTSAPMVGTSAPMSPVCPQDVPTVAKEIDPDEVVQRADAFVEDILAGRYKTLPDALAIKENALALPTGSAADLGIADTVDRWLMHQPWFAG